MPSIGERVDSRCDLAQDFFRDLTPGGDVSRQGVTGHHSVCLARLFVLGGPRRPHRGDGTTARGIGFRGIVGWCNLLPQPIYHGLLPRQQGAQAIADHFALAGILAASDVTNSSSLVEFELG